MLFLNINFLLKINTWFHSMQPTEVLSMHGEHQPDLRLLCMRRPLKFYLMRSRDFRDGDNIQLFLVYDKVTKGKTHFEAVYFQMAGGDNQVCLCHT